MASDGCGKLQNKKSKLAAKLYGRPKSFFGGFGSTLKEFLTPSLHRESSRPPANAGQNVYKEEEKTHALETVVVVSHTDDTIIGGFESKLKDFLTPSLDRESSRPSANAGQNVCKEEEKTHALETVVVVSHTDDTITGDGSQIQEPASDLTELMDSFKTLLGGLGSTLKEFLTPAMFHESSFPSTDAGQNDCEEEVRTQKPKAVAECSLTNAGQNDCKGEEKKQETKITVECSLTNAGQNNFKGEEKKQETKMTAECPLTTAGQNNSKGEEKKQETKMTAECPATTAGQNNSKGEEKKQETKMTVECPSTTAGQNDCKGEEKTKDTKTGLECPSTNAGQNDFKEEEKTQETVEAYQTAEANTEKPVDCPLFQETSSSSTEIYRLRATRESIKVEVDFLDLLHIARTFAAKTSGASSQSCYFTGGIQQGSVIGSPLFNLFPAQLCKTPAAEHDLYVDDIKLFIFLTLDSLSNPVDHLRAVAKFCSW